MEEGDLGEETRELVQESTWEKSLDFFFEGGSRWVPSDLIRKRLPDPWSQTVEASVLGFLLINFWRFE